MIPALLAGAGLGGAGLLAARAASVRQRELVLERVGSRPAERSRRPSRTGGRIAAWAAARGWPGAPLGYVAAVGGAGSICSLVGFRLAGPVGGLAGLVGGPGVVEALLSRRRARGREAVETGLRDAVVSLAAGVRAGLSVRRAIGEAARDADPSIRPALTACLERLDVGESLEGALRRLAEEVGTADARLVTTILEVHARVGGNLPALLDEVAEIVGSRVEARRQAWALTAQGRVSGAVLAVLPVTFVTLLSGTSGDGLGAFYRTSLGATLLAAGLVCDVLGFVWIRRIVGRAAEP